MKQALMQKIKELSDIVTGEQEAPSEDMGEAPEMEMSENKDKQESDLAPQPMIKKGWPEMPMKKKQ